MPKPKIIVTGANGQVAREIALLATGCPQLEFIFLTRDQLSIENFSHVQAFLADLRASFCINCAAYTSVDQAEAQREEAFAINGHAVGNLAIACREANTRLIHLSTDYVFDGTSALPYTEEITNTPVNVYGASKLLGEQLCFKYNVDSVIIRTAWIYSEFGNNFVKTMLRLMNERDEVHVVNDQVGSPTYARDLSGAILKIVLHQPWFPGIYHYANKGRTTWFEFALTIKEFIHSTCHVKPVSSMEFHTVAKRPSFSLLNTKKIESVFHLTIPKWKDSLHACLQSREWSAIGNKEDCLI